MYLLLIILHSEDEWERVAELCIRRSHARVMAFEGSGVGRTTARKLFSEPSFSPDIWKHLETKRQWAITGFAVMPDLETAREVIAEIETITGGLEKPSTGIVAAIPLLDFAAYPLPQ